MRSASVSTSQFSALSWVSIFSSSASAWAYVVSVLAIFYSIDCVMVDMMSGPEAKVVVMVSPGLREELSVTARPAARVME